jgi:hypothetical protein
MKSNPPNKLIRCKVTIVEADLDISIDNDDDIINSIAKYQNAIINCMEEYRSNFIRFVNFVVDLGGTIDVDSDSIYKNPITIKISEDKINIIKKYRLALKLEVY